MLASDWSYLEADRLLALAPPEQQRELLAIALESLKEDRRAAKELSELDRKMLDLTVKSLEALPKVNVSTSN